MTHEPNPAYDLVLERVVDVPRELVWAAWTQPELMKQWFTPAPWRTTDAEVDLRPGGIFRSVMEGPNGERADNAGCILEVVENEKFVWTGALKPGYRPYSKEEMAKLPFVFTAVISLAPHGQNGTKYTALVIHPDEASRTLHDGMGFQQGWGAALDQLVAMVKRQQA